MGRTKDADYSEGQRQLAALAHALAHPARVAILEFLVANPHCFCGEIVEELPLSQATVSQHLKELKKAGFIKGEVEGPRVCYCVDPEFWQQATAQLGGFFEKELTDSPAC